MMSQKERDAQNAIWEAGKSKRYAEILRKKYEFAPVTVGEITITPTDQTLSRLYAVILEENGVQGWRADNGVFDLTHDQAFALYRAGRNSLARAFIAQRDVENGDFDNIEEAQKEFLKVFNYDY